MSILTAHRPHLLLHTEQAKSPVVVEENQQFAKLLVVDDSDLARMAVARILKQVDGLAVIEARDGRHALEVIERESPSAVLTDMQMPNMDGLALVAEMREHHEGIPAIVMTAYGSENAAMQALRCGAANYIPKCALASDLAETVKRVLSVCVTHERKQRAREYLQFREARFLIQSDPGLISPLVELLLEDLVATGVCNPCARVRVGVALNEALANAIFHGNLEVSSDLRQEDERHFYALAERRRSMFPYADRQVAVDVHIDRHRARFEITDDGLGFDTSCLDRPIEEEDLLRIGGRGFLLIRAFMDEVRHNSSGNQITLTKRF